MATISYTAAAKAVAQVDTITPGGTIAATDIFTMTVNGKSLSFTATTTTVDHVVTGLKAAFDATTEPEWGELTASDDTTTLTLAGRTLGKPFTVTTSINNVSGGAAPTLTQATTTSCSGPAFANVAANYSGSATPSTGDTLIVEGDADILYGLDLSAVTLARMIIRDYGGRIGLPPKNDEGNYPEYRDQYLKISATVLDIMDNVSSGRIRLNVGSAQTAATVMTSGTSPVPTIAAVTLVGTHASNVVNIMGGQVGIATETGETSKVATLRVGGGNNRPNVTISENVTLTTVVLDGGDLTLYADFANGTVNGGTLNLVDDPDISGTLTIRKGSPVIINGGPTIAKIVMAGGTLDMTQDARPVTVTNCDLYSGSTIRDPYQRVTWSNAIVKKECDFPDVSLELGNSATVSFA